MTIVLSVMLAVAVVGAMIGWALWFQASRALVSEQADRRADTGRIERAARRNLEAEVTARMAKVDAELAARKKEFFIDAGNGAIIKFLKIHHPTIIDEAIMQVRDPEIRAALGDYWGVREGGYSAGEPAPTKMRVPLPRSS